MAQYEAKVSEASRELTAREKIRFKDITATVSIDLATSNEPLIIEPTGFAVIDVHNEKSENPDYKKYVVEAADGELYSTGSESFWKSFMDIYTEMAGEDEKWHLKIFRKDSNNYKGKQFITCTIL
jgi:hypothetical protein